MARPILILSRSNCQDMRLVAPSIELHGNLRDGAEALIAPALADLLVELGGTALDPAEPVGLSIGSDAEMSATVD